MAAMIPEEQDRIVKIQIDRCQDPHRPAAVQNQEILPPCLKQLNQQKEADEDHDPREVEAAPRRPREPLAEGRENPGCLTEGLGPEEYPTETDEVEHADKTNRARSLISRNASLH